MKLSKISFPFHSEKSAKQQSVQSTKQLNFIKRLCIPLEEIKVMYLDFLTRIIQEKILYLVDLDWRQTRVS